MSQQMSGRFLKEANKQDKCAGFVMKAEKKKNIKTCNKKGQKDWFSGT